MDGTMISDDKDHSWHQEQQVSLVLLLQLRLLESFMLCFWLTGLSALLILMIHNGLKDLDEYCKCHIYVYISFVTYVCVCVCACVNSRAGGFSIVKQPPCRL